MLKYFQYILLIFLFSSNTISSQNIDSYVTREFNKLKRVAIPNFNTTLKIVEFGEMKSDINGEVTFSKEQLKKISNNFSKVGKEYLIRILLAHELSHQFQFNWYKNKEQLEDKPILRMLLEGQADMLAGYCFGYLLIKDNGIENLYDSNIKMEDFYSIFQFMLDIGIEEHTLGTHPSKGDRLMLIKQGMEVGLINAVTEMAHLNPSLIANYYGSKQRYNELINEALKLLDFDNKKDNLFSWSYKITKRIINYNPEVAKNLVLISKSSSPKFKWHTNEDYPYVDYKLKYLNISNKAIDVEMEVFVSHVSRENRNAEKYHSKRNLDLYKFRIQPKEIKTLEGKLRWDKSVNDEAGISLLSADKIPRIVFPSSNSSNFIISCSYANETHDLDLEKQTIKFLAATPQSQKSKYQIATNIKRIIRAFRYNQDDLFSGIGDYYIYSNRQSYIEYNSTETFDKGTEVKFYRNLFKDSNFFIENNFSTEILITYNTFYKENSAMKKFNLIIEAFDLALPTYVKEVSKGQDSLTVSYHLKDIWIEVFLDKVYDKALKEYIWDLEVEIYD